MRSSSSRFHRASAGAVAAVERRPVRRGRPAPRARPARSRSSRVRCGLAAATATTAARSRVVGRPAARPVGVGLDQPGHGRGRPRPGRPSARPRSMTQRSSSDGHPVDGTTAVGTSAERPARDSGPSGSQRDAVRWRHDADSASPCASSTSSSATSTATPSAIIDALGTAEEAGADLAVFPELAITGYPPEDLLLKPGFVADNLEALAKVAAATERCAAVVGFVDERLDLYNAAAVCAFGQVAGDLPQAGCCPTTACSTSSATSRPGPAPPSCSDRRGAGRACRSARTPGARPGPIAAQAAAGAELVVNINASPVLPAAGWPSGSGCWPPGPPTPAARWSTSTWSAARTSWSSTAPRWSSTPTATCWRPPRSSRRRVMVVDLDVRPVFRKRLLDPRGRAPRPALPVIAVTAEPRQAGRCRAAARPAVAAARPGRGGLPGPGPRHPRLRHQERLHRRGHRPVGRHRLVAGRGDRGRRPRARARPRRVHAVALLERPLPRRRRRAGRPARHRLPDHRHRAGPRRLARHAGAVASTGGPRT